MISPGMIRAGALMSKGVSSKEAINQGINLDLNNATRRDFFEAANKNISTVSMESSVPWLKEPKVQAFADINRSNILDFSKDYKTKGPWQYTQSAKAQIYPSTKVINTFITDTSNLNYIPDVYIKNPVKDITTDLDKLSIAYSDNQPASYKTAPQDHTKRLSSYFNLVNTFLNNKTDVKELKTSYDSLMKELTLLDDKATQANKEKGQDILGAAVTANKTYGLKTKLTNAFNDIYENRSQAILGKKVNDLIDQRFQQAKKANPALTAEKFFEDQSKQYSLDKNAFGFGQLLIEDGTFKDYQDYLQFINPGKYSNKYKDIPNLDRVSLLNTATREDANAYGLELSRQYEKFKPGFIQDLDLVSGDYRLGEVKDAIIYGGQRFAAAITQERVQQTIDDIRQKENLIDSYTKKATEGKLTKNDLLKVQSDITTIDNRISYNKEFDKAITEAYRKDKLSANALITNFAYDRYNFNEKAEVGNILYNSQSKFDNVIVGTDQITRTLAKGFSSLVLEPLKFVNDWYNEDENHKSIVPTYQYDITNKLINYAQQRLEVPTYIDEVASKEAGRIVNSNEIFYSDPGKASYNPTSWNFQLSGALNTVASVMPQMWAFNKAGRLVQGVFGTALKSSALRGTLGKLQAEEFTNVLAQTGDPAAAWGITLRNSKNIFVREVLADRLPGAIGQAAVMYPEQYNRTVERLYALGIKDAEERAHVIARNSTIVEIIAENAIPNIRFNDAFPEKGVALGKLIKKGIDKLPDNLVNRFRADKFAQYSNLYSGILGGKLSEKTLGFLARNSADIAGKLGSGLKFYASRGKEEGFEEVFSELVNAGLDTFTNYAAYRHEDAHELTFDSMTNAFLGGFLAPTSGGINQIKAYSENKKYGAMYDMMLNADYYRNKINEQVNSNKLDKDKAASMLANLQQLTSLADEYGVKNLKKKIDGVQFTSDLVNSPEKQFDYFKSIIKVKGIEEKLAKEDTTLKQEEKDALLTEAAEATKRINNYKRQSDMFVNLSPEKKQEIVQNTIDAKAQDAKFFHTSETINAAIENADIKLATAIKDKKSEEHIQSIRDYKQALITVSEERKQAESLAIERGTFNPIINALLNGNDNIDTSQIESADDAQDLIAQAMMHPETGRDLYFHLTGQAESELAQAKEDQANLLDHFLDYLEQSDAEGNKENGKKVEVSRADTPSPRVKYQNISDLNDKQQAQFEQAAEELETRVKELEKKQTNINKIVTQVMLAATNAGNLSIQEQESFLQDAYNKYLAVSKKGFDAKTHSAGVIFDILTFAEFLHDNKTEINKTRQKIEEDFKKTKEEEGKSEEVIRNEVPVETTTESGETTEVVVPELLPEDVTPEFEEQVTNLENIQETVVTPVENQITGEIEYTQEYNQEKSEVLKKAIQEVMDSPTIEAAKAKVAVIMEAQGDSPKEIAATLELMDKVSQNKAIFEEDQTHMFDMLELYGDFTKKFGGSQMVSIEENLGIEPVKVDKVSDIEKTKKIEAIEANRLAERDELLKGGEEGKRIYSEKYNIPLNRVGFYPDVFAAIDAKYDAELAALEKPLNELDIKREAIEKEYKDAIAKAEADAKPNIDKWQKKADEDVARSGTVSGPVDNTLGALKSMLFLEKQRITEAYKAKLNALENPTQTKEEVKPTTVTEENREQVEANTHVSTTSPLFNNAKDAEHFGIQSKIIENVSEEYAGSKPAIVDLFTFIEQTLGKETLDAIADIFDRTRNPKLTAEEKASIKAEFLALFPPGYFKAGVLDYMFDKQMIDNLSVADVSSKGKKKANPTEAEKAAVNHGKTVSIKMKDGRVFDKATAINKEGKLLFKVPNGRTIIDKKTGEEKQVDLWIEAYKEIGNIKEVKGLVDVMEGSRPISLMDLNTLVFTVLDKQGKVQKYNKDGQKNKDGQHGLLLYLPKTTNQANQSEVAKAQDAMKMSLLDGTRVNQEVQFASKPIPDLKVSTDAEGNVTSTPDKYVLEYTNAQMIPTTVEPSLSEIKEANQVVQTMVDSGEVTQESTVAAINKLVEDSKAVGDPSKEGYKINGKKYERQSGFVKRVLGESNVVDEDGQKRMELGAAVGNFVDIIGRDVLGGRPIKSKQEYIEEAQGMGKSLRNGEGYSLEISDEVFDNLIKELKDFTSDLTGKGWKLFTEGLIIHREFTPEEKAATGYEGVAGAMDILAVDPDGKVHIIDFKNKVFKGLDAFTSSLYKSSNRFPSNVSKWSIQQTTYSVLSEDFGLPVDSINILAFASEYKEDGGKITIDNLTPASNKQGIDPKHVSPISDKIIALSYSAKIMKQLEVRTQKPTPKSVDNIKENQPKVDIPNVQNAYEALSSLGININNQLNLRFPTEGKVNPEAINPKDC